MVPLYQTCITGRQWMPDRVTAAVLHTINCFKNQVLICMIYDDDSKLCL